METLTPPVTTTTTSGWPRQRHRRHGGAAIHLHPIYTPAKIHLPYLCSFPLPIPTLSSSASGLVRRRRDTAICASVGGEGGEAEEEEEVNRAMGMDGRIPGSSEEFVRRVSSRAYDMRRHLMQSIDSISYDGVLNHNRILVEVMYTAGRVLENNPWRDDSKPVYVLTQRDNQLCTMKTRRSRSEVERELGLLFSKSGKLGSEISNKSKHSKDDTRFNMFVEDIREGVLVFEDEHDASKYCDLLQGGGQGCEGIAEVEASSVFDICRKMRALAVLFRRGTDPPLPKSLEQNLRARKRSLEDQDIL